jgi:hypothetical protein
MKRIQLLASALWILMACEIASAQELKKVRMGYPAFSLTFLTFSSPKTRAFIKDMALTSIWSN